MSISQNITATLRAEEHGHQPIIFEPGAVSRIGGHTWYETAGTLRADMGDNQISVAIPINTQIATRHSALGEGTGLGIGDNDSPAFTLQAAHSHAVAIQSHPSDSRVKLDESGTTQTLTGRMGTGGGNVPLVMNERQFALTVSEDVANTPIGTDFKGTQCIFEPVVTAYGICSDASHSMRSKNPNSGIYEADTSRTLDGNCCNPSCQQGGTAIVALQGSMMGRKDKNGPQGSGINTDICFSLTSTDKHAVAYAMTTGGYSEINEEQTATLMARDYKDPQIVTSALYTVRRLTPSECALLQGFPLDWCAKLETADPSDDDIARWADVFETHRKILGKSSKPKSRTQIIKWLKNPHSDAAEYKMWGNGVALPCVRFVMAGIVWLVQSEA